MLLLEINKNIKKATYFYLYVYLLFIPKQKKQNKKKNYTVLKFGTRAWYTRVLCKWYSSLPSSSTT